MVTIRQRKTNPNGANQYLVDPRQALFLSHYLDPKSGTFSNCLQSALKAGYEQNYAENLTAKMPEWLKEKVGKLNMLSKAEKNLDKILDLETKQDVITMIGPLVDKETGKRIQKENPNLLRIKADISKFVAETIGKEDYGKNSEPQGNTYNVIIFNDEQSLEIARRRLAGDRSSEKTSH